jgi:hypothetical protein
MHVVYALSNYLIFDRYSELVSQVYKEISVRLLLKLSKHVYTRNISYESSLDSELFRFADNLISKLTKKRLLVCSNMEKK